MGVLVKIVIAAAALWVAVQVVPGLEFEGSVVALLLVALVLGVINAVVKPILTRAVAAAGRADARAVPAGGQRDRAARSWSRCPERSISG